MGQYYKAYVADVVYGGVSIFVPPSYKLMEHAWIGNVFVDGVMAEIMGSGGYVAWIGDYADEVPGYDLAWGENCHESDLPDHGRYSKGYLVNHSKGIFLRLEAFFDMNEVNGMCIHPLPILTACGNGRGGGDYYGYNQDLVGCWAFDLISFEQWPSSVPENYTEIYYGDYLFDSTA